MLACCKDRLRAFDVDAIELLGVLRVARDLARAVEGAVAPGRGFADGLGVEHVSALRSRERDDLVPAGAEERDEVASEKSGGAGDEVLHGAGFLTRNEPPAAISRQMRRAGVSTACAIAIACGGEVAGRYNGAKIGDPCVPAVESSATFAGFDQAEVSVELPNPDADPGAIVCLADHFRGRVSCPYGNASAACATPDAGAVLAKVEPQCVDRKAADVVTWSCRCANAAGATNDGATYCGCPDGTTCTQLVVPIAPNSGPDISGAYCINAGTAYQSFSVCLQSCDPNVAPCP